MTHPVAQPAIHPVPSVDPRFSGAHLLSSFVLPIPSSGTASLPLTSSFNPAHWEITPAPLYPDSFFSARRSLPALPQALMSPLTIFQGHSQQSAADTGLPPSRWNPRFCFRRTDCLPGLSPPPASPLPWLLDPRAASSVGSRPVVPGLVPSFYPKGESEGGCLEESS